MNSGILLIPLFLIRYGLLALINKKAFPKAAFFAPMQGTDRILYWIYQISTIGIILYMPFLKVETETIFFKIGSVIYCLGVLLLILATISFAKPKDNDVIQSGLYRFSRNPMYVAFFVYLLGCVLLTASIILSLELFFFQLSAHWIILAEERWCIKNFGEKYIRYMKKVRRYL